MDTQVPLEDKHLLLKNELDEKLKDKDALELEITKRFEELKTLEIFIEKRTHSIGLRE